MKTLYDELAWRGFINQTTFADVTDINEPRTFYWGVDPSADSMTIGNLAAAMMIRHLIDGGHKAVLLVGGATGMIGDPDGKKQERDLLTVDEIAHNKGKIAEQYKQIFAGQSFEIVDNYDWFKEINFLDFLRDVGKHAPLTQMLDRDFVQTRIGEGGSGISYAEFSYSLIQGYDFLHLFRTKGATMQVGGSDQWGNMISGVQLIRRLEGAEAHVFSTPLIVNKQTGVKFGKSEGGAVWLDPTKTSPYKFYQFWLNVDDETAEDLVKVYTLLDQSTVEALIDTHRQAPHARALQKTLAREVSRIVHGSERTDAVEKVTTVLFGTTPLADLSEEELDMLSDEIPTAGAGATVSEILMASGIAASASEVRRLIQSGAVSLNGEKIQEDTIVSSNTLVKKGKNNFVLVR
ncbi:MAG TPA: tyrosine--tRNA ligase [Patescibacteria group bacterium]|jgi:tyrosyl-tRNA synthetase|nr:tyrosine--tRNA ligase [Patescibacteria group bacterium]